MTDQEFMQSVQYLRGYLDAIIAAGVLDDKNNPEYQRAVERSRLAIRLVSECAKQTIKGVITI